MKLNYIGRNTIYKSLMEMVNLMEGKRVRIVNYNISKPMEACVIKRKRNPGTICLSGVAARKTEVGDMGISISCAVVSLEKANDLIPVAGNPGFKNQLDQA